MGVQSIRPEAQTQFLCFWLGITNMWLSQRDAKPLGCFWIGLLRVLGSSSTKESEQRLYKHVESAWVWWHIHNDKPWWGPKQCLWRHVGGCCRADTPGRLKLSQVRPPCSTSGRWTHAALSDTPSAVQFCHRTGLPAPSLLGLQLRETSGKH